VDKWQLQRAPAACGVSGAVQRLGPGSVQVRQLNTTLPTVPSGTVTG